MKIVVVEIEKKSFVEAKRIARVIAFQMSITSGEAKSSVQKKSFITSRSWRRKKGFAHSCVIATDQELPWRRCSVVVDLHNQCVVTYCQRSKFRTWNLDPSITTLCNLVSKCTQSQSLVCWDPLSFANKNTNKKFNHSIKNQSYQHRSKSHNFIFTNMKQR